jgi:hypothetical protein
MTSDNLSRLARAGGGQRGTLERVQALRARRAAQAAGAQFRLAAVAPAVQAILDRTGTSRLLSVYPGLDAARDGQEPPAPDNRRGHAVSA